MRASKVLGRLVTRQGSCRDHAALMQNLGWFWCQVVSAGQSWDALRVLVGRASSASVTVHMFCVLLSIAISQHKGRCKQRLLTRYQDRKTKGLVLNSELADLRSNAFAFKFDTRGPLGWLEQIATKTNNPWESMEVHRSPSGLHWPAGKLALVTPTNLSDEADSVGFHSKSWSAVIFDFEDKEKVKKV